LTVAKLGCANRAVNTRQSANEIPRWEILPLSVRRIGDSMIDFTYFKCLPSWGIYDHTMVAVLQL
jgi:hypothetical protein